MANLRNSSNVKSLISEFLMSNYVVNYLWASYLWLSLLLPLIYNVNEMEKIVIYLFCNINQTLKLRTLLETDTFCFHKISLTLTMFGARI